MALSNMLREPQREITETVVGVLATFPVGWLDYEIGVLIHDGADDHPPILLGMIIGLSILLGGFLLAVGGALLVHALGERICDALDDRGIRLRPSRRPKEEPQRWDDLDTLFEQNRTILAEAPPLCWHTLTPPAYKPCDPESVDPEA